jgi:4-hydroxy-4-methyl-2-oxoglutarate aldolase
MKTPLPQPQKYFIGKEPALLPQALIVMMAQLETTMLGHILYWGCMDRGIQANQGYAPRTVGRALTVQCPAADSTMLHHAIGLALPGDILVIDRLGDDRYACLGDGVAGAAMRAGIVAAIIDGPCTDAKEMAQMQFPVWCRGTSPITTRLLNLAGRSRVAVSCGGVCVSAGDVILADSDGVFALPPDEAAVAGAIALQRGQMVEERRKGRPDGLSLGQLSGATAMVEGNLG